jgi:Protein of unknown function (DUF551).
MTMLEKPTSAICVWCGATEGEHEDGACMMPANPTFTPMEAVRPSPTEDDTEMCDACDGSGFGVADTYCGKCGGAGGYPRTPTEGGWQPIETAPKDGTRVLVSAKGGVTAAEYKFNEWWCIAGTAFPLADVTHWQPLPKAPKEK